MDLTETPFYRTLHGFNRNISFTFQAIQKLYVHPNLGVIFGYIWEEIVFLEGLVKLREIRNIEELVKF